MVAFQAGAGLWGALTPRLLFPGTRLLPMFPSKAVEVYRCRVWGRGSGMWRTPGLGPVSGKRRVKTQQ